MTQEQITVLFVLGATMGLFLWGRWRYDLVAVLSLLAAVALGLVPAETAFHGFGHPAVITVAAVLMMSRALQLSGVADRLSVVLARASGSPTAQVATTGGVTALFSAFMNNIGALALMLPVALRNSDDVTRPASTLLMPLAFASLLGGLVTQIGTPPNIIIATFRAETVGEPFAMFDFTPVGLPVALIGLVFISTIGWRLLPRRQGSSAEGATRFRIDAYISQATVPAGSKLVGGRVRDLERRCANEVTVMALIRGRRRLLAPASGEPLEAGDILMLEGEAEALGPLFEASGLVQVGSDEVAPEALASADVQIVEVVVMPGSGLEGSSMRALKMHEHYGINLLAVARQGHPPMTRLGSVRFRVGDMLLLQGAEATLREVLPTLGCLALAGRRFALGSARKALLPVLVFVGAIVASGLGLVPIQLAFVSAVAVLLVAEVISPREAYRSIEWPVVVLLGALIPVGGALQTTGAAGLIATGVLSVAGGPSPALVLVLLMAVSMLLSDLVHNSPTAILMAPVALDVATGIGMTPDPFLMAVAIGAASPYLTPIGHQSNTLVMGPGGYRFSDYWRLGLPLDAIIVAVAVPMILWVWVP